jgi:hypothetical protein
MKSLTTSACLFGAALALAPALAEAQVGSVAKRVALSDREYWEVQRFGSDNDQFWRDYTAWYNRRPTFDGRARAYEPSAYDIRRDYADVRPYYGEDAYEYDYNPRMRASNPRLNPPYADPRAIPYTVRRPAYTTHELRLLEENDGLVPDSFEPMDEDISRWPAQYRDFHDMYNDTDYRRPGYFWPASGFGVHPYHYWERMTD